MIPKFLALFSELQEDKSPHYPSVLESLLHLLTDLKIQQTFIQTILVREYILDINVRVFKPNLLEEDS